MSGFELSLHFFFQVAVILAICRAVGLVARRLGQPQAVAEMIAGVVIGPSLFGALFPNLQAAIFPADTRNVLFVVSQVGLVLYMFLVGLEFDTHLINKRLRSAAAVSISGIIVPFLMGSGVALFLFGSGQFFSATTSLLEAALFTGASMSITAFPMLARIIHERGLAGTSLGTLVLGAGSIDDAVAWCIMAVVLASISNNPAIAALAIGGGLAYALILLTVGRRLLRHIGTVAQKQGHVSDGMLALTLILVMLGAWFTDSIGIYAVFGAFLLGVSMRRGLFATEVRRKLQPLVTTYLLPLFFVYSGLNTRIGLVDSPSLWLIALVVFLAASLGKGGGCWLAARLSGENQKDAAAIGVLMNARGLMELIILNMGLERGIIAPLMFTVMVIMALLTTLLASPLFDQIYARGKLPALVPDAIPAEGSQA